MSGLASVMVAWICVWHTDIGFSWRVLLISRGHGADTILHGVRRDPCSFQTCCEQIGIKFQAAEQVAMRSTGVAGPIARSRVIGAEPKYSVA